MSNVFEINFKKSDAFYLCILYLQNKDVCDRRFCIRVETVDPKLLLCLVCIRLGPVFCFVVAIITCGQLIGYSEMDGR